MTVFLGSFVINLDNFRCFSVFPVSKVMVAFVFLPGLMMFLAK